MGIYNHAAAYRACPGTELVAMCDTDPEKLNRAGERWKVTARYTDARELLTKSAPEVISICTPDAMHFDGVKAALASPSVRGILAEKPLALEVDEAEELVKTARSRGVAIAVNYSRRYSAGHAEMREWIRGGGLGRIVSVGGFYTKGTLHNGSHWFDLARWIIGEITEVFGFDMLGETGADPTLDAILRFENGATGHLQAFDASAGTLFEMDILGTQGRVRVVEPAGQFATFHLSESRAFPGYRVFEAGDVLPARNSDTVLHAVEDLVACVKNGGVPRCSAEDGLAAVRVARAVRDSARLGRPISLQKNG
jgi:predicted dehydrogenase